MNELMRIRTLWIGGWMLLACLLGCAQPVLELPPEPRFVISGTVRAGSDPLPQSSVAFKGAPLGAPTDDSGAFTISGVRAGTYTVTVIHLGLRSQEFTVQVPGSAGSVELVFTPDPILGRQLAETVEDAVLEFSVMGSAQ